MDANPEIQEQSSMIEVHEKHDPGNNNEIVLQVHDTNYLYTHLDPITSAQRGYTLCGKGLSGQDSVLHIMGYVKEAKKEQWSTRARKCFAISALSALPIAKLVIGSTA